MKLKQVDIGTKRKMTKGTERVIEDMIWMKDRRGRGLRKGGRDTRTQMGVGMGKLAGHKQRINYSYWSLASNAASKCNCNVQTHASCRGSTLLVRRAEDVRH